MSFFYVFFDYLHYELANTKCFEAKYSAMIDVQSNNFVYLRILKTW